MVRNYFVIAIRNILRFKTNSIINIFGLAMGMAAVMLIGMFIVEELSFDRFHENSERIFRASISTTENEIPGWMGTPPPLATLLGDEFPEIESYVRFDPIIFREKIALSYKNNKFYENRFMLADKDLFGAFSFKLIKGDKETVLENPSNLVLSESMARKYFGELNPVGEVILFDGTLEFIVSGVMEDVPSNSHLQFDFIAPFLRINEIYGRDVMSSLGMWNFYTYLMLRENVDKDEFAKKSSLFLRELTKEEELSLYLQPVTDIHLSSEIERDRLHTGNMSSLYLYGAIALVILLIAGINFMNLYTANSEVRSKEVGVRKVMGAEKKQLITQFLGESLLLTFAALPAAILLVAFFLPEFNNITGKSFELGFFLNPYVLGVVIVTSTLIGAAAGWYPALFVSSFQPVQIFRLRKNSGVKGLKLRNMLVIFQFASSIILIACSLLISSQMSFIRDKNLGYNRENILNIPLFGNEAKENYLVVRDEFIKNTNVIDATATSFTPSVEKWRESLYFEGKTEEDEQSFFRISGDYNFTDLFKMTIIAGRTFNRNLSTDLKNSYILNESAVKAIGWDVKEAIGKSFGQNEGRVIGVVKDFNFRSLRLKTEPMVINIFPRMYEYISVKIKPGNIDQTISSLENSWRNINPELAFEYFFYDEEFDKLYKADQNLETLLGYFTLLAIFIACLGLFGLSIMSVNKKQKEIGIRKVLGANSGQITYLITSQFVRLVIVSVALAIPIAYYAVSKWLEGFVYRTEINLLTFLLAGILAIIVAILTTSIHVIKASLSNPVDVLRNE